MELTRRDFILGSLAVPVVARFDGPAARDSRTLVVLQLTGGNDGLNTVAPTEDDLYHRARPRLAIAKGAGVKLAGGLELHPAMKSLQPLLDEGELAVVTDVGYPDADRSHFRSMDVWHCGCAGAEKPAAVRASTGWIGRAADRLGVRDGAAPALHVGSTEQPLSLLSERTVVPSILDTERTNLGDTQLPELLAEIPRQGAAERIAESARAAYAFSRRLHEAAEKKDRYPPRTELGRKLRTVTRILGAGLPVRIFYVEIDGFDTHSGQGAAHTALLQELADSLAVFHSEIRARGLSDKVLTMAFSEFGRRVAENGSAGTDHGAAGPVLLAGGGLKGGVCGGAPDLEHLDDGDVAMRVDFRRVYATVLEGWLGLRAEEILGAPYEPVPFLRT